MDMVTRSKVSETQKRNWEKRRAGLDQLEALKTSHRRILEVLGMCAALVERQADNDPLAKYVLDELEAAQTALEAENIAGFDFINETS